MKVIYYLTKNGALFSNNSIVTFIPNSDLDSNPKKDNPLQDDSVDEIKLVDTKRTLPLENIASIACFASVDLNTNVLNLLTKNNIPIILFDNYNPVGCFYPSFSQIDGDLTVLQSLFYISKDKRLEIARAFISGSINNKILNLSYYANRNMFEEFQIPKIELLLTEIDNTRDINSLMLLEAQAQKLYFAHFNQIFKNKEFIFTKREFNPSPDPVNSLLSYSYALLYSTLITEIATTKLNPFISYLHSPGANRTSLIWDISEIFKPLICDRLVFNLINHKIIKPNMFSVNNNQCFINKTGKQKIVQAYNEKLKTTIFNRENQKQQSYRYIIRNEYYKIINYLKDNQEYKPFKIWW